MGLDIAHVLKQVLEQVKKCEEEAKAGPAAELYDKAAKLMREYARQGVSRDTEIRRLAKARDYEARAKALREGKVKLPEGSSRAASREPGMAPNPPEEYQAMIASLKQKVNITWDNIGGLEDLKRELKFAFGLAMADKPDQVKLYGPRNILLYGPPGTGKTLIAAATSSSLNAAFYNVKVGSLLSKWYGESSKLVSILYTIAREEADEGFVVIFYDEFDALSPDRDSYSVAGPDRRVLSSLLAEMDGLKEKGEDRSVLTMAATNAPWDLDHAVLSRFQKRIYVPLPDATARHQILQILLERSGYATTCSYEDLVGRTNGFSGRDLERLCGDAINRMIAQANPDIPGYVDKGCEAIRDYRLRIVPLGSDHFEEAFKKVRIDHKRLAELEKRYKQFEESY